MSATFKLTAVTFPNGTTVKAYLQSNWPTPVIPSGAPIGSAAAEGTVSGSSVTFSGLTKDAIYWAVAEVGGAYRYVSFIAGADHNVSEETGSGTVTTVAGEEPDEEGNVALSIADITYAADIRDKVQSTTGTSEVKFPTEKALATEKTRAEAAETAVKKAAAGVYGRLYVNSGRITEAAELGKKYILGTVSNVQKVESSSGVLSFFRLVAADLAVSGLTAKLKLQVTAAVFATAPNVTIIVGLVPLTAGVALTPGSFVSGSEITFEKPAKETAGLLETADFTLPSDGAYAVGYTVSGTPAAGGSVILNGAVLAHAV